MGTPCLTLFPPQKFKFFTYGAICSNLKPNIFICLPMIIEIKIWIWGSPCPGPLPPSPLKKKSNSTFLLRFY